MESTAVPSARIKRTQAENASSSVGSAVESRAVSDADSVKRQRCDAVIDDRRLRENNTDPQKACSDLDTEIDRRNPDSAKKRQKKHDKAEPFSFSNCFT